MPEITFEDFHPGDTATFGRCEVTPAMIVAFARQFDPQPFHTDADAAKDTFAGRLIASGWHTGALQMRMVCDAWLLRSASMGGPGLDELRWLKPVLPGDVLSVRQTIQAVRESRSRPDMGLVQLLLETLNGDGEVVMTQSMWMMQGRRAPRKAAGSPPAEAPAARPADSPTEEAALGPVEQTGSHHFTADDIVAFGRAYDPQPFHVDEAAGRASHFGGLAASGWHTAGAWIRQIVEHRAAAQDRRAAAGKPRIRYGTSPGIRNLRWPKPVLAGDTLTFATRVVGRRASASRPGWEIVSSRSTGTNQHGDLAFSVDGAVFVETGRPE